LLVDDMEENLLALEGLLRRSDLNLIMAKSGTEALELLLDREVALAIVDVQMPGMDGFELAEIMRESRRTRHIPIIFLTAGQFDDIRRFRGYEAGAVDVLFKPIEPAVLQGKADVFFDLYCQRQEVTRQRDELRASNEENDRLYKEILELNRSLEERVRERTVQLVETNEQLNGFTYSIAHDFRQHIRNININAEIVLSEEEGRLGPLRANLTRIRDVAKLMNQMTDDLLTYARIRNAKLRPVNLDLTALAEEIADARRASFPKTVFDVQPDLWVCADMTMIRIVLENLIDNAFKYSQDVSKPHIEVGKDEQGFFVRDNGAGFDMAYVDKLFRPFERLLVGSEIGGTGMGLANVKRVLDHHGGHVWADSKIGEGTVFHFSIG
jgi:signal transduction histidine kinase